MHFQLETLVFVAYLDSLLVESAAREAAPLVRDVPDTLNRLHADAMREHARRSALLTRADGGWIATPDWRLDRQIIRLALYLRERFDVAPGQRIAVVSELRPEWLIADLAALGLGAVSIAIDPGLPKDDLASALEDAAPTITFASSATLPRLQSLDGQAPAYGQLILLDSAPTADGVQLLQSLLEMGGTLDTPERAQAYRAAAREVSTDQAAVRHYSRAPGAAWNRVELTQGQVIERLRAGWLREPARSGDVAYVSDPTVSLAARLAAYAFLGDGYTTTALAPGGGDLADLAGLHPTKIVTSAGLLAEAVRWGRAHVEEQPGRGGGWLSHAARLVSLAGSRSEQRAIRVSLGGRVRWIGSTDQLDSALAEQLGGIAVVGPAPI